MTLQEYLNKGRSKFEAALPVGVNPGKWWSVAMTSIFSGDSNSKTLSSCPKASVALALMEAANDGLLVDGKESIIVGYGGRNPSAQYQRGYRGVLKLIRNSGEAGAIGAQVVYEKDEFDAVETENGMSFTFRKFRGRKSQRGERILAYAYLKTKDGETYFADLDLDDMEAIRDCSRVKNLYDGPWGDEMYKKSAIHRLFKIAPSSTDVDLVMAKEEESFDLDRDSEPEVQPYLPKEKPKASSKLRGALGIDDESLPEPEEEELLSEEPPIEEPPIEEPVAIQSYAASGGIKDVRSKQDGKRLHTAVLLTDGKWYSTFSKSKAKILNEAHEDGMGLDLTFVVKKKKDKEYRNIEELKVLVLEPETVPPMQDDEVV
jgi:recombination protein RecT